MGVARARAAFNRLLLVLVIGLAWASEAAVPAAKEDLKAVFLYNFTQFVEWPPETFQNEDGPIIIGILGPDPFGKTLDDVIAGEKVNNRSLKVIRFDSVEEITICHVLFINEPEFFRLDQIMARLRGRSILTVGETEDFARRGGMIRFMMVNKKIKLRINVDAAELARLKISSKLLRISEVFPTDKLQ